MNGLERHARDSETCSAFFYKVFLILSRICREFECLTVALLARWPTFTRIYLSALPEFLGCRFAFAHISLSSRYGGHVLNCHCLVSSLYNPPVLCASELGWLHRSSPILFTIANFAGNCSQKFSNNHTTTQSKGGRGGGVGEDELPW